MLELDTQALVDIPVFSAVVSKAQPLREATSITTVISGDEIRALGARDLKEVLDLVPDVSFGTDVANIIGIAFRGIWAQDGRVLLQIDGQPMNELAFGSLQFGNHYPVQAIERIGIIRGPGSINYGGFAGLGVSNVISKKDYTQPQGELVVSQGATRGGSSQTMSQLTYGTNIDGVKTNASLAFNKGVCSSRSYTNLYGASFSMQDDGALSDKYINYSVTYKDVSFRYIRSIYHNEHKDFYFSNSPLTPSFHFDQDNAELAYQPRLSDQVQFSLAYQFHRDIPWHNDTDLQRHYRIRILIH